MEEANKFNEWMIKTIHSLHFADSSKMILAYEKFTEKTEEVETTIENLETN
jgi:hypothetical protein